MALQQGLRIFGLQHLVPQLGAQALSCLACAGTCGLTQRPYGPAGVPVLQDVICTLNGSAVPAVGWMFLDRCCTPGSIAATQACSRCGADIHDCSWGGCAAEGRGQQCTFSRPRGFAGLQNCLMEGRELLSTAQQPCKHAHGPSQPPASKRHAHGYALLTRQTPQGLHGRLPNMPPWVAASIAAPEPPSLKQGQPFYEDQAPQTGQPLF